MEYFNRYLLIYFYLSISFFFIKHFFDNTLSFFKYKLLFFSFLYRAFRKKQNIPKYSFTFTLHVIKTMEI